MSKPYLKINIGDVFGDLECIGIETRSKPDPKCTSTGYVNYTVYLMKCRICGREKYMLSSTIRVAHGITHKGCGKGVKTIDPIFYDRWQAMRTRTTNPNYEHANCYSERGINSDEFENFIDFYDAMYPSWIEAVQKIGDPHNVSLERIDVNGNYTKDNCSWISLKDQKLNMNKTVKFVATYPDGTREVVRTGISKFARDHNLNYNCIADCLNPKRGNITHQGYKFERFYDNISNMESNDYRKSFDDLVVKPIYFITDENDK